MTLFRRATGFAALGVICAPCLWAEPTEGDRTRAGEGERREAKTPPRERLDPALHTGMQEHVEALVDRMAASAELRAELGITEEQASAIRDGIFELRRKQVDLRAALEKAGLEQARLMMQPQVDEEAVMKVIDEAGRNRSELAKLRVRELLLVKRTLTQEQLNGLRKNLRERLHKRGKAADSEKKPAKE
jgi:Spy/CpxP family protein refolding chaperone